jgi:hypothetical protein
LPFDRFSIQERDLKGFQTWNSLQKITLFVWSWFRGNDSSDFCDQFQAVATLHGKTPTGRHEHHRYYDTIKAVKAAGGEAGYLAHLEREIALPMQPRTICSWFKPRMPCVYTPYGQPVDLPNKILADWANAFEGRLLVDGLDGTLCYDKGDLVRSAFLSNPWLPGDQPSSSHLFQKDVNVCRLGSLFIEAKRKDMMPGRNDEERFWGLYRTYFYDLLDYMCRDWEVISTWSIEERIKMVGERFREYNRRNGN